MKDETKRIEVVVIRLFAIYFRRFQKSVCKMYANYL